MKKYDQKISEGMLFTDQYQLTMAQLYFKMNLHEKETQFDHFFRDYPDYGNHKAGYCINAGLEWLLDWMENTRFTQDDLTHLSQQKTGSGKPLFEKDFLNWLKESAAFDSLNISAIPEGRVVHRDVPVTVVKGPLAIAQILETVLLNQLNFQILVATKAARIKQSGREQPLIDFGARRAQDRGANAAVRAALIGGADFSSNVGISHLLGYPPRGTHAHSMVQLFLALRMSELEAFQAFADLYPENCILLVDTINTLESGIPNAIKVFENLRRKGYQPAGIRLDSGDLAYLTIRAAEELNKAGFRDVNIVLSNELDEMNIWQIISQIEADAPRYNLDPDRVIKRLVFGVGTRLITSGGHAALGGVYKLTAVKEKGEWIPAIKISENPEKTPNPANKIVWRIYDEQGMATADLLGVADEQEITERDAIELIHPVDANKRRTIGRECITKTERLLIEIYREGKLVYDLPDIESIRKIRQSDLDRLNSGVKRLIRPHIYHVSLTEKLWNLKQRLIQEMKSPIPAL